MPSRLVIFREIVCRITQRGKDESKTQKDLQEIKHKAVIFNLTIKSKSAILQRH